MKIKMLRGQIRQIVKEILPEVLKDEVAKVLNKIINDRLDSITKHVDTAVNEMNERSKETQNYVVRNLALANVQSTKSQVVDNISLDNASKLD